MFAEIKFDKDQNVKNVKITIGENEYRITKSIDDQLMINKYNPDGNALCIHPIVTNEINIK